MAAADALAMRVLVVDDDRDAAGVMASARSGEGTEMLANGASASLRFSRFSPIVLLDIGAKLDG
jgi:DNA-binding response OmpR family regulator